MAFNSLLLVLPILILLMYGLGLELRLSNFTAFAKQPKSLLIGLFAQLVLLPLIAFLLIYLFHLPYPFAVGVLLLALSPGGSSSNAFSMLAGGNVALSVALTAITSVVTIFTLPLVIMLYVHSNQVIDLPVGKFFIQNIVLILLPLVLGMLTLKWKPLFAAKCSALLKRYGIWLLFILVVIFFIENRQLIFENFGLLAGVLMFLLIITTSLGTFLGRVFHLSTPDKRTIFIEIGMQNAAQAIAIASSPLLFNSQQMAIPAVIYAFLMNIFLLLYLLVQRYKSKIGVTQ